MEFSCPDLAEQPPTPVREQTGLLGKGLEAAVVGRDEIDDGPKAGCMGILRAGLKHERPHQIVGDHHHLQRAVRHLRRPDIDHPAAGVELG